MAKNPRIRRRRGRRPIDRVVVAIRRNPVKSITAILVLIGSIPAAMAGFAYVNDHFEPWKVAFHGWVHDQIDVAVRRSSTLTDQSQKILRDLQIDTAEGKRASTINDIKKWQLELNKAPDQNSVDLITQQVDTLQDTKTKLDAQLRTLRAIKGN